MDINDFIEKHLNEKTGYVELLPIELIAIYESGKLTKENNNQN